MGAAYHDEFEGFSERAWCLEQRDLALQCLEDAGIEPGDIPDMPAWHLAPYVSIWLVENRKNPKWAGWWVICGDLPSDFFPDFAVFGPREAMHAFGMRWRDAIECLKKGERHPVLWSCPPDDPEGFASMLQSRADFLVSWSDDDACWGIRYAP